MQSVSFLHLRWMFCIVLAISRPISALAQFADSPARGQLSQWLMAFDSDDKNAYAQFLGKNFPSRAGRMQQDWAFRSYTGGFDLIKVEENKPNKVTALIQERDSDRFARIEVTVDPVEPHRITTLELRPIERPQEFALKPMNDDDLIALLRKHLEQLTAADRFAGVVLIAKDGKPIFSHAYGLANRNLNTPNRLDTKFRTGSMNKMFTAVAILQLAQAGKLNLDDSLRRYLPDYPNKDLAAKATIKELLTHSAGTGDIFGPEFEEHRLSLRAHEDYLKLYGARPVRFEPGSQFEYSNYGFLLLGLVIEKASGRNYYDYVREHIYSPASMASTGSEPEDEQIEGLSIGYTKSGTDKWHSNANLLPYRGTSAGGGYSTVGDLLRFANALRENRLLNPQYTSLLETAKVAMPTGRGSYAYGLEVHTINGSGCVGHSGGSPGMNADLEMCLDSGYVVATLANMDPLIAQQIEDFIVYRLHFAKLQ